jgi:3-hydroxyisobutyrate dehydrogenase-like beta-hydroxyacid dehydrogenase
MMRPFRRNVGIVGLGIIGRRVADHLRRQGLSIFVWNRTPRPVPNFVGSPAELAQTCNYLQVFVSDDEALMRIVQLISPSLTSSHVIIAHPTVSPDTMREAASLIERRGARLVEAPFTGSKLAAEKGQLVYYVAGDEAALNEVRPLLQASSKAIVDIGEIGQASIIKVATNMVTAASVQAAAEAMALVHYSGIGLEKFAEAIKHNTSNSATLDLKIPRIMAADFDPHFSVKHMLKDMQIANRLGRGFDLDLTVAGAARDRLLDEARQGRGDEDFSSIARRFLPFVEETAGDLQPDLFSQPMLPEQQSLPREEPEFVERQLAEISATYSAETSQSMPVEEARLISEPETEFVPPEPVNYIPVEAEIADAPTAEAAQPISAEPEIPVSAAHVEEVPPEPQGFFRRLLRRTTDY